MAYNLADCRHTASKTIIASEVQKIRRCYHERQMPVRVARAPIECAGITCFGRLFHGTRPGADRWPRELVFKREPRQISLRASWLRGVELKAVPV